MLKSLSRARVAFLWCAAVLTLGACAVVVGAAITLGNGALLLVACLAPPAVMLLVWNGPPPLTVAEVLHAIDGPVEGGRS
jgi:hypothetical protein